MQQRKKIADMAHEAHLEKKLKEFNKKTDEIQARLKERYNNYMTDSAMSDSPGGGLGEDYESPGGY